MHDHDLGGRTLGELVLIFCVGGQGWLKLGRRRYEIIAGDCFCCPAGVNHAYGCDPKIGWEIWWCHARGAQAMNLCKLAGFSEMQPVMRIKSPEVLVSRFATLVDRLGQLDSGLAWDAAGHLHQLLVALIHQEGQLPSADNLAVYADMTCESLDDLVRRSGYSKFHFCREFKAQTGRSPWKYVLERKIERAQELLLGTPLSIKEIAASLGFNNADYFAKQFQRHTGVTPKLYRGRS
ncbi:MAG TPA: AraC family transcriptional regulator [Planctomycetota bacterium]|nr:AraC family transcriptional regulator [Planctomycetota bacterium]